MFPPRFSPLISKSSDIRRQQRSLIVWLCLWDLYRQADTQIQELKLWLMCNPVVLVRVLAIPSAVPNVVCCTFNTWQVWPINLSMCSLLIFIWNNVNYLLSASWYFGPIFELLNALYKIYKAWARSGYNTFISVWHKCQTLTMLNTIYKSLTPYKMCMTCLKIKKGMHRQVYLLKLVMWWRENLFSQKGCRRPSLPL